MIDEQVDHDDHMNDRDAIQTKDDMIEADFWDEETFSTPCGSMTSDEIQEHIEHCEVCAAEHADTPLDI